MSFLLCIDEFSGSWNQSVKQYKTNSNSFVSQRQTVISSSKWAKNAPCHSLSMMRDASCNQMSKAIIKCNETTERQETDKSFSHVIYALQLRGTESNLKPFVASGQNNISAVLRRIKLQLSSVMTTTDLTNWFSLLFSPQTHLRDKVQW